MNNGIKVGSRTYTEGWGTKRKGTGAPDAKEKRKAYMKEYMSAYQKAHPEKFRESQRRCVPPLSELIPGYVPLSARQPIPPPPCGGDCENGCPYDECRFPDWDEEQSAFYIAPNGQKISREAKRRSQRKYDANLKQRRKEDPKLDADVRAKNCGYAAKHRAKVKFVKAGGTPEEFELEWRKAHESG